MGKQTDAHITTVNTAFTKLTTTLTTIETESKAFRDTWSKMMTAYDTGGKNASVKFGATLKADAVRHDQAVTNAKAAWDAADKAVTDFDTFVTAKDKGTINPLKKTSLGKAKKFVANAKQSLVSPDQVLKSKSSMQSVYQQCVGIYY
jgi:hypothetical protein